jgi:hypothetical protein
MIKNIIDPCWGSPNKDKVICIVEFVNDDGSVKRTDTTIIQDPTKEVNEDWDRIFSVFTEEQIDNNTQRVQQAQEELIKKKRAERNKSQEQLFEEELVKYKTAVFDIQEIKESNNSDLKHKMAESSNIAELLAYTATVIYESTKRNDTTS